jgi:hypothetical protein
MDIARKPLAIYTHNKPLRRTGMTGRAIAMLVAVGALAMLVVAAMLRPEANGVGTHMQLGLAPCGLLRSAGIPCMSCGMTTAITHLVHGNVLQSFVVQPAGAIIGVLAACATWAGAYVAVTGRPGPDLMGRLPVLSGVFWLLGIGVVAWGYKIVMLLGQR